MNEIKKHPEAITRSSEYSNPFKRQENPDHLSHGAVAIESERAVAQIQAKVVMAKTYPRIPAKCFEALKQACMSLDLAEDAFYSYPKGKEIVHGGTIRLAEELAQIWGNIDYQVLELGRREGETEMQAVAWDMETNTTSSVGFTIKHYLDTKSGGRALTEQRDIRDLAANISSRKIRGRIFSILPAAVVKAAIDMCRDTLARSISATLDDKRAALVAQFKQFGVTEKAILQKFDVKSLNAVNANQTVILSSMFKTIKANEASAHEIFELGYTSQQIKERTLQAAQNKPQPPNKPQTEQKPPAATEPEKTQAAEPQNVPAPPVQEKPQPPRKGTVAWYKLEIESRGITPVAGKMVDLQTQYADILESEMRAKRQGEEPGAKPPTTVKPETLPEPPAAAYEDDDDWGFEE